MKRLLVIAALLGALLLGACKATDDSSTFTKECPAWSGFTGQCDIQFRTTSSIGGSGDYISLADWDIGLLRVVGGISLYEPQNIIVTDLNGKVIATDSTILDGDYIVKRTQRDASFKIKSATGQYAGIGLTTVRPKR